MEVFSKRRNVVASIAFSSKIDRSVFELRVLIKEADQEVIEVLSDLIFCHSCRECVLRNTKACS